MYVSMTTLCESVHMLFVFEFLLTKSKNPLKRMTVLYNIYVCIYTLHTYIFFVYNFFCYKTNIETFILSPVFLITLIYNLTNIHTLIMPVFAILKR